MTDVISSIENWIKNNQDRIKFIAVIFIAGFLTHGYMLANKFSNHDDVNFLFDIGATYDLGRWFLPFIGYISNNVSMPWFIGIISILLIAISALLVCEILQISSKIIRICIGVLMVSFPVVASTFLFMYTAIAYSVALILATLCVWYGLKGKKYILVSILCCVLSIALYQSYFCFSAGLFVLSIIKKCIDNDDKIKNTIIRFVIIFPGGLLVYWLINKVVLNVLKIEMADHKGLDKMGMIDVGTIKSQIVMTYTSVVRMFKTDYYGISATIIGRVSVLALLIVCAILLVCCLYYMVNSQLYDKKIIIIYVLSIMLYPMSVNCIYILCSAVNSVYTIMLYSDVLLLILPLLMVDRAYIYNKRLIKVDKVCQWCTIIAILLTVYSYELIDNAVYLKVNLIQKEAESICNQLITRIMQMDGYRSDMPVAVIGKNTNETLYTESNIEFVDNIGGVDSVYTLLGMDGVRYGIMKYYCGFSPTYIYNYDDIKEMDEYKEMPVYPDDGSIKIINDTVVVKFRGEND